MIKRLSVTAIVNPLRAFVFILCVLSPGCTHMADTVESALCTVTAQFSGQIGGRWFGFIRYGMVREVGSQGAASRN